MNPSLLAADYLLYCRALSVGVTFLCVTCVDPGILQAIHLSLFATLSDLVEHLHLPGLHKTVLRSPILVLEQYFLVLPAVGQNSLLRIMLVRKLFKLKR